MKQVSAPFELTSIKEFSLRKIFDVYSAFSEIIR